MLIIGLGYNSVQLVPARVMAVLNSEGAVNFGVCAGRSPCPPVGGTQTTPRCPPAPANGGAGGKQNIG